MREKGKWFYLLFFFMVAAMFLQGAVTARAAGQGDPDCSLVFLDRAKTRQVAYYETLLEPEDYDYGEKITIVDHGVTRNFRFIYGDFYDSSGKSPGDYGYAVSYVWEENYDADAMISKSSVGKSFRYRYLLVKGDEDGNPVDSQGKTTTDRSKFEIYAQSDIFTLESTLDYISTTINDILYYVYEGENFATVVCAVEDKEPTIKTAKIKKSVTINGKTYPVTTIGRSAFDRCIKLSSVSLPESIKVIYDSAFKNTALKSIIIPDSVEEIGDEAFAFNTGDYDEKTGDVKTTKTPGFVMYAKGESAAERYCSDFGIKLFDEKAAKKVKVKMTAKALAHKKVRLQWNKTRYVTGFQIYRLNKKTGKYIKAATVKDGSAVSWTSKVLSGTKKGSRVYYKVRAYTKVGSGTVYGKWSQKKSVKIK